MPRPKALAAQSAREFASRLQWDRRKRGKQDNKASTSTIRVRQSHGGEQWLFSVSTITKQSESIWRGDEAGTIWEEPPIRFPSWFLQIQATEPVWSATGKAPSIFTLIVPADGGCQIRELWMQDLPSVHGLTGCCGRWSGFSLARFARGELLLSPDQDFLNNQDVILYLPTRYKSTLFHRDQLRMRDFRNQSNKRSV